MSKIALKEGTKFANEAAFSRWVQKQIKKHYPKTLVTNITNTGRGTNGVHDLILCHYGLYLSVELKMPGNKLTALQDLFADKVTKAGGIAISPLYPEPKHVEGFDFFLAEIERGFERRKLMQSLSEEDVKDIVRRAKEEIAKEADDD